MGRHTRIYQKFECRSVNDCRCESCLHRRGKKRGCALEERVRTEERPETFRRERCAAGGLTAREEAAQCPA
jgi:hypothetical protein